MLQYLDPYERMNLADALSAVYFKEGDCIIKEGDPADGMYFIESGEVGWSLYFVADGFGIGEWLGIG